VLLLADDPNIWTSLSRTRGGCRAGLSHRAFSERGAQERRGSDAPGARGSKYAWALGRAGRAWALVGRSSSLSRGRSSTRLGAISSARELNRCPGPAARGVVESLHVRARRRSAAVARSLRNDVRLGLRRRPRTLGPTVACPLWVGALTASTLCGALCWGSTMKGKAASGTGTSRATDSGGASALWH
jgi:hypothetical protein